MELIANSQLHGVYGDVEKDRRFNCPDVIGNQLLKNGKARRPILPITVVEKKIIAPREVGPVIPFRDVPMPDAQPAEVSDESDTLLSKSNVRTKRVINNSRRRGRKRNARK
jgi:hypothetical protein